MPVGLIKDAKEQTVMYQPLLLAEITKTDGSVLRLCTHGLRTGGFQYGGYDWLPRITNQDVAAMQALSEQGIDYTPNITLKFRAGFLNAEERRRLQRALSDVCEMPLFIDDHADASLKTVHRKVSEMRNRVGLGLVVVDYLQLMNPGKKENRTQEVGALSRGLKLMAREFRVRFLVLSQLSRAPEQRPGNHQPQMSDLREGGGIEQDADVVAFIFREEGYKPDNPNCAGWLN